MDIQKLLKSLLDHKVKFLVIGAWALPAFGYVRMTEDVDLFIEPTRINAKRTIEALRSIGYLAIDEISLDTLLEKKILLRQYILKTDIHPFVKGVSFKKAWKNRKVSTIKGFQVFVPSLDDLMTMKKKAGREKDLIDLEVLKEIKKQLKEKAANRAKDLNGK